MVVAFKIFELAQSNGVANMKQPKKSISYITMNGAFSYSCGFSFSQYDLNTNILDC